MIIHSPIISGSLTFADGGTFTLPDNGIYSGSFSGSIQVHQVKSHLVPNANEVYDLGSSTNRFRDLYLSNNTIDFPSGSLGFGNNGFGFSDPFGAPAPIVTSEVKVLDESDGSFAKLSVVGGVLTTTAFDPFGVESAFDMKSQLSGSFTGSFLGEMLATNGVVSGSSQVVIGSVDGFTAHSASVDSRILTEKGRVDAILETADADKDSFAEIVTLINSVDTTNDSAFAGFVTSSNAAQAVQDGRLSSLETETGSIATAQGVQDGRLDALESFSSSLDGGFVTEGELASATGSLITTISNHTSHTNNPHSVTAAQVGLGNVDNTSDANKPVSIATQTALDLKATVSALNTEVGRIDAILATADADKDSFAEIVTLINSVDTTNDTAFAGFVTSSNAAQAVQDGRLSALETESGSIASEQSVQDGRLSSLETQSGSISSDLSTHIADTTNPHSVTATQVGLGNVTNESKATMFTSPTFTGTVSGVTATHVGLGNVDNTSDVNKPVSTAQQTALDLKADDSDLTTHTGDTTNPHSVTATQVGLGNVTNESKATMFTSPTFTGTVSGVTATHVGLGNVDNTSDSDKPISTATQTALDLKATVSALTTEQARIDAILSASSADKDSFAEIVTLINSVDTSNPHSVTKAQVGLGNVENTALSTYTGNGGALDNQYITNGAGYTTYTSNQATNTTSAVTFASVAGGTITGTSVSVTGDVVAYSSSDRRLKDNIVNIPNALEKVQSLNGVTWDWNDNADELQKTISNVGVIAQEVEAVLPQLIQHRDTGYMAVDYAKLTGLLIEAVKEQQKQIDELKARLG